MNLKQYLEKQLAEALKSLDLDSGKIQLTPPKRPDFGDLSTSLPLQLARQVKQNPMALAEKIKEVLNLDPAFVSETSVTPPGFINFRGSNSYYQDIIKTVQVAGKDFSRKNPTEKKTANVEFVSANPTGPLTVGHGRQAVLGDAVASILEWHGYDVTREYYYNDAGRQMRLLGQSVEAQYFDTPLPEDGYQGKYIKTIAQNIIEKSGKDLKPGDAIFRKEAEDHIFSDIKRTLDKIGIHHDVFSNEKTFYDSGAVPQVVSDLKEKDLIYEADGATWFKTTAIGMEQDRVLIKSSGEPTYRLPDIAYHRNKLDRGFDLVVDIFGADHQATYPDVLIALQQLGYNTESIRVLIHQFVTLVRGGEKIKMSTRKGTFVTLEKLIDEVGIDVVRYFFIMRGMNSHLNFDLDLAAEQSDKNPVFYLQYAYARICNIIKHGEGLGHTGIDGADHSLLSEPSELDLLKFIDQFSEMMDLALSTLEPQTVANYLHGLAGKFHKFYADCRVVTDDVPLTVARLALISTVKTVLGSGLNILGLSAPERM